MSVRPGQSVARADSPSLVRRIRGTRWGSAWPSVAAGGVALVLVARMAWDAGGYFPASHLQAAELGFLALAVILALRGAVQISVSALVGLGSLLGLAAWTSLSAGWSRAPDAAVRLMQLDLVYVALFGLGLVAAGSGRFARNLVWAVLLTTVAITTAGVLSRVYPHLVSAGPDVGGFAMYRLQYPLSYWNAYGATAAVGCVLAAGLAADPRSGAARRAAAAGMSLVCFLGMYLSLSRGAWLALAVGIAVLLLLGAHRGSLLLTVLIVAGGATILLLRLRAYPALVDDPHAGHGQVSAGHAFGPQLAGVLLTAVLAQGSLAAGGASPRLMRALVRVWRPVALAALACLAVLALVAYGLHASSVERATNRSLNAAGRFFSRQWSDFLHPAGFTASGTARLATARGTRADLYRVALDGFAASPLRGEGGGSFQVRWFRSRRVAESVRNAHSLELETLDELGLLGGALLLGFLGSMATAAIRARLRPGGLARAQAAAVGAACAVWIAHSALDWDWQMPGFTGLVVVLAASLHPYGRKRSARRRRTVAPARSGVTPPRPEVPPTASQPAR